jgi:hypothetical protein
VEIYQTQDTNYIFNSFLSTFLNIFEASFPVNYRRTNEEKNDWITQGIKISCKHNCSLYTFTENSNDPKAKAFYIKYCRILKKLQKKQQCGRLISKSSNNIKPTWNIIKRETGKVHPTEQARSLLVNNEKLKDPTIVANAFNNFFLTATEKLNTQKPEKGDVISFLKVSFPKNVPSIKIIPITETEITSKILKTCTSIISLPLSFICNHSLHTGIFPDHLKIAIMKPLDKKGDKFRMINYHIAYFFPRYLKKLCTVG